VIAKLYSDLVTGGGAPADADEGEAEMERIEPELVYSAEGHYETVADLLTTQDFSPNEDIGDLPEYLKTGLDLIK
jgi:hypothetical protein